MPGTAARDQRDLAGLQRPAAHEFALRTKQQDIGVRGRKAVKALLEYRVGAVDQLFHERPPDGSLTVLMNPSADALGVARELRRKIDDELFERTVLLVVAKVRHRHRDGARARFAMGCAQPTGMRASVGYQECCALGAGQMANFEDDRDVLGRN